VKACFSEAVDRSALEGELVIRSRLPGDRYRPLGSPGSRKLKELFREKGVDQRDRNAIPILADAKGIVWAVGHRPADRCRVRSETEEILRVEASPVES
jgi:tRNA(Ile)-lysidine synthase